MAFLRTKIVVKNGKRYVYRYWQKSVRKGKNVKSVHLGRDTSLVGVHYIESQMEKYPGDPFTSKKEELAQRTAKAAELFKESTGLTLPTTPSTEPVEKATMGEKGK